MNSTAVFLLRALSLLPLSVLYGMSKLLKVVLRDVVMYRKSVITSNLRNSFPELSQKERDRIMHNFYAYLADLIVESIHLLPITKEELAMRVQFDQPELLERFQSAGKRGMIMMGHSGNWEWAGLATAIRFDFTMLPIYRRIKNPEMDALVYRLRSRWTSMPVLEKDAFKAASLTSTPHVFAVLADQTPSSKKGWWLRFLNQDTPFYRGGEVLADRFDYEVIFAHVFRTSRGHYRIHLESYQPEQQMKGALTTAFVRFLEIQIKKQPENWLWSHQRWKHEPNANSTWID